MPQSAVSLLRNCATAAVEGLCQILLTVNTHHRICLKIDSANAEFATLIVKNLKDFTPDGKAQNQEAFAGLSSTESSGWSHRTPLASLANHTVYEGENTA